VEEGTRPHVTAITRAMVKGSCRRRWCQHFCHIVPGSISGRRFAFVKSAPPITVSFRDGRLNFAREGRSAHSSEASGNDGFVG
jgi:hypothetical protein